MWEDSMKYNTEYKSGKYYPESIHASSYGPIKILGVDPTNSSRYYIEFVNSGSCRFAYSSNIKNDNVKDYYALSVEGVGYLGDFDSVPNSTLHRRAYVLWANMLNRCYGTTYHSSGAIKHTYKDVSVSTRWLCYSNFYKDLPSLAGYRGWLNDNYELDKDRHGHRLYSASTCSFITREENIKLAHDKQEVSIASKWVVDSLGAVSYVDDYREFAESAGIAPYELLKLLNGSQNVCRGYRLAEGTSVYTFSIGDRKYTCTDFKELAEMYGTMTSVFWKLVRGDRLRYKDVRFTCVESIRVCDFDQNK